MSRPPHIRVMLGVLMACTSPLQAQQSSAVPSSIEAFRSGFVEAVRARDVDRWAAMFAVDGVMMAPSGRVISGRQAFHDLWTRTFEGQTGPNPLVVEIADARVEGGLAVVRADYGPEGASPVGQYVWMLERRGEGPWLLAWWIFNRRTG